MALLCFKYPLLLCCCPLDESRNSVLTSELKENITLLSFCILMDDYNVLRDE